MCFEALHRQESRGAIIRLLQALKDELFLCAALAPLAATCIKASNSPWLYESDASGWGWAVVKAELPQWLQSEVHRHRLTKSVWSRMLSPLKTIQRLKGILPPSDELPDGVVLASHPLHIELASSLQCRFVSTKPGLRCTSIYRKSAAWSKPRKPKQRDLFLHAFSN